jgi:hypothetical protein
MAMFMVAVINLFGHLAQRHCNYLLEMLQAFIRCVIEGDRKINKYEEYMINGIPKTVQTTRKRLGLAPILRISATCPTCSAIYEPVKDPKSGVLIYPPRCGNRRWEKSDPCNTRLTKTKVENGESIRVPIRPFVYQPFLEFVGRFLSRPEVEDALDRSRKFREAEEVWDIAEAEGMREVLDVDGNIFVDGPKDELRLIWRYVSSGGSQSTWLTHTHLVFQSTVLTRTRTSKLEYRHQLGQ